MKTSVRHPAKFTDVILDTMLEMWPDDAFGPILDPFAGTGKVHLLADQLGLDSFGVELEREWAVQAPSRRLDPAGTSITMVGDALMLPFPSASVGCVVTSPCYGNRMADHHEAKDLCRQCVGTGNHPLGPRFMCRACGGTGLSRRNTYTHALGRKPTTGSAAVLQWGAEYRAFHEAAWAEVYRVLAPGGYFFLNVKDHIRYGVRQYVSDWHWTTAVLHGFKSDGVRVVNTPGNRQGKNGDLRIDHECVLRLRKPL